MKDFFRIAAPLPLLGLVAEKLFLRRYMLALLRERNDVIKRVAESGEWAGICPHTVRRMRDEGDSRRRIRAGCTVLARHFNAKGDETVVLSRNPDRGGPWRTVPWDGARWVHGGGDRWRRRADQTCRTQRELPL